MTTLIPRQTAPADSKTPERRTAAARRENLDGLAMVAPTLLVVVVVVIIPVLWNLVLSFQSLSLFDIRTAGLFRNFTTQNFNDVFTDPDFWISLRTTVIYAVLSTAGSIVVGLIAALSLRRPVPGRGVLRAFMLLPYVAPVVAAAFVWKTMLDEQSGIVNYWGSAIFGWRDPVNFLGTEPYALFTVIAFEIWRYFPFAFLFVTARLLAVPHDIEEAAIVDGATPLQNFRYVLLPQLLPVLGILAILRLIMTFNKFDDVYLLTGGGAGTDVAAVRVIDKLNGTFDIGGAAAEALALSAILAIFLVIYVKLVGNRVGEQS